MTWSSHIDDPRLRLAWVIPFSLVCWLVMLNIFAWMLAITKPPHPAVAPADVRIVELPISAGPRHAATPHGTASTLKPKFPSLRVKPRLRSERLLAPLKPHPLRSKTQNAPTPSPLQPSPSETARVSNGLHPPAGDRSSHLSAGSTGTTQELSGVGTGSSGARAIYAPQPVIPDSLREEAFQTVAVARFKVGYDGRVEVTLVTPTESVQLNEILLDTLKRWRFFPAMKSGVAVDSQFDLRIPISVE